MPWSRKLNDRCRNDRDWNSAQISLQWSALMQSAFFQSECDQPHPERTRAILKAHPEIRELMGRNPFTALIGLVIVVGQTGIACAMGRLGGSYWWLSLIVAYGVGAFANHCSYVIIHDATHNLVFRSKTL